MHTFSDIFTSMGGISFFGLPDKNSLSGLKEILPDSLY